MCKLCDKSIYSIFGSIYDDALVVCANVKFLPNDLIGLKSLNISNNKHITYIPSNLTDLVELDCSYTNITYIQHEFTKLKNIKANNSLLFSIGPFSSLEKLDISFCNNFNHLSKDLIKLVELNISNTNITSTPDEYMNLEILNCSNSKISTISKLYKNLLELDCSFTEINFLPNTFLKLIKLNCDNTKIKKIPGTFLFLKELNWVTELDEKCSLPDTLISLETLVLYKDATHKYNNEFILPDTLTNLRYLNCEFQSIKIIPDTFTELIELNCSNNMELTDIPSTLTKLKRIYCSRTSISSIPDNFSNLMLLQCEPSQIPIL